MSTAPPPPLPICFVLMPIADTPGYEPGHFARVYEHLLKPAIIQAGFTPIRADDAVKTDYIVVGIIQKIVASDMVLCDFSARNPNVMYELGIRHAFGKPVVLIRDRKTEKIFDIQGLRYTEYDESLRVDSVGKDTSRIAAAIKETASGTDKDMNSIVALAGIKTAEVPQGQTISPDTRILLNALTSLDSRIQKIEELNETTSQHLPEHHFVVHDENAVTLFDGTRATLGEKIYDGRSNELGTLMKLSPEKQTLTLNTARGERQLYRSNAVMARSLTTMPF